MGPDRFEDRGDQATGHALQDPVADRLQELDPFQDLRLGLAAEPLQAGDPARLASGPEVSQAFNLQLVVQQLDLLRAEPGNPEQGDQPRRGRPLQILEGREMPGGGELGDLGEHGRANPGNLRQAPILDHPREVGGQPLQRLTGVVIGPNPKGVLPPDFEERPHLGEDPGDPLRLHLAFLLR